MFDLSSNQAFDQYAAKFGWVYDNSGQYLQQVWDWYVGDNAGVAALRQAPDRVCVVQFEGLTPTELWSGTLRTSDEFDQVMSIIEKRDETKGD